MTLVQDLPRGVRALVASAIRARESALAQEVATSLATRPELDRTAWHACGRGLVALLALTVEDSQADARTGALRDLAVYAPRLTMRVFVQAVHRVEQVVIDELALHVRIGAASDQWPIVTDAVHCASMDVLSEFAERDLGRASLHDPLMTLLVRPVFDLALRQEALRAQRHQHGIAAILFDIDELAQINLLHGFGTGDRLLERLGILARTFFRLHDWVARHGDDSIAVLLPETTLDQAAALATRFLEMVRQRLMLTDHHSGATSPVTVSAAAVGTDDVAGDIDPAVIVAEAEAAVLRAQMNGGNRIERVALLPSAVTIIGAATLLGLATGDVSRLIRNRALPARKRGRHFYIDRTAIDEYRTRRI